MFKHSNLKESLTNIVMYFINLINKNLILCPKSSYRSIKWLGFFFTISECRPCLYISGTGIISSPIRDRLTPPAWDSSSPCSASVVSPELEGFSPSPRACGVIWSGLTELRFVAAVLFLRPGRVLVWMKRNHSD